MSPVGTRPNPRSTSDPHVDVLFEGYRIRGSPGPSASFAMVPVESLSIRGWSPGVQRSWGRSPDWE